MAYTNKISNLVSVVIPSWNRKKDLRRLLKSLEKQDYPLYEIIVVDNGSDDGSVELIEKEFPRVHLHKNIKNLGACTAKNQGTILANGTYVHFLDSDTEMTHDSVITNMVKILKKHPEIGSVGGEAYKTNTGVITKRKEITLNGEAATYIMYAEEYTLIECGYVATCNAMMRKKDLEKCRGFDSNLFYMGEDKEIGYKLKMMGLKSVIDSRCLVYHYISDVARISTLYLLHKNRIRIVLMNFPLYYILILPVLDILCSWNPKKFKELRENNRDVLKWVPGKELEKSRFFKRMLIVGSDYGTALIRAYLYNIVHIPETMYLRFKRVNFLEETKRLWL